MGVCSSKKSSAGAVAGDNHKPPATNAAPKPKPNMTAVPPEQPKPKSPAPAAAKTLLDPTQASQEERLQERDRLLEARRAQELGAMKKEAHIPESPPQKVEIEIATKPIQLMGETQERRPTPPPPPPAMQEDEADAFSDADGEEAPLPSVHDTKIPDHAEPSAGVSAPPDRSSEATPRPVVDSDSDDDDNAEGERADSAPAATPERPAAEGPAVERELRGPSTAVVEEVPPTPPRAAEGFGEDDDRVLFRAPPPPPPAPQSDAASKSSRAFGEEEEEPEEEEGPNRLADILRAQQQQHKEEEENKGDDDDEVPEHRVAYKILRPEEWREFQAAGVTDGTPMDLQDGYIHLSTAEQAAETAAKYYSDVQDIMLVACSVEKLREVGSGTTSKPLRWEASRGGLLFPHLYRPLRLQEDVLWYKSCPNAHDVAAKLRDEEDAAVALADSDSEHHPHKEEQVAEEQEDAISLTDTSDIAVEEKGEGEAPPQQDEDSGADMEAPNFDEIEQAEEDELARLVEEEEKKDSEDDERQQAVVAQVVRPVTLAAPTEVAYGDAAAPKEEIHATMSSAMQEAPQEGVPPPPRRLAPPLPSPAHDADEDEDEEEGSEEEGAEAPAADPLDSLFGEQQPGRPAPSIISPPPPSSMET